MIVVWCVRGAQLLSRRSGSPGLDPVAHRPRYACMSSSLVWKYNNIIAPPFYRYFFLPFIYFYSVLFTRTFFQFGFIDTLKL